MGRPKEEGLMKADAPQTGFDLSAYARKHRYRVRNLHDGGPVPPALPSNDDRSRTGYIGASERWNAIVGYNGYVTMDGEDLSVCLFYKSAMGVNRALVRLKAMGAEIDQVGDTEVGATVHADRIEDVLRLIRVSRLRPGDVSRFRSHTEAILTPESHEDHRATVGTQLAGK